VHRGLWRHDVGGKDFFLHHDGVMSHDTL